MSNKVNPLLIKLMLMTTSPHDGEALNAIRKANAILAEANVNWAEFLAAVETTKAAAPDQSYRTPPSQRRHKNDDNAFTNVGGGGSGEKFNDPAVIDPLFEKAFAKSSGSFSGFLESVFDWWTEKGFLTEKQFYAIKRAAE